MNTSLWRGQAVRRGVVAMALGLAGFALNLIDVPVLGDDSPSFLFGGAAVLLAFVLTGSRWGTLSAVVALLPMFSLWGHAGFVGLIYVGEAWAVMALYRRWGVLLPAVATFWFAVGWVLDIGVYGWLLGCSREYVLLLFVKQILNGLANALIVQVLASPLRTLAGFARPVRRPLQTYVYRWALGSMMAVMLTIGFVYARDVYGGQLRSLMSGLVGISADVGTVVRGVLDDRSQALRHLTRTLEIGQALSGPDASRLLEQFYSNHPEILNVGVADRTGVVVASAPERNALGTPLTGRSVAARPYFIAARDRLAVSYVPLVMGRLHVRDAVNSEPVLIVAEPLLNRDGTFAGVVWAAFDSRRDLPDAMARVGQGRMVTMLDHDLLVIASSDPRMRVGESARGVLPVSISDQMTASQAYSRTPAVSDVPGHPLEGTLLFGAIESVQRGGWYVMVEESSNSLRVAMLPAALKGLGLFVCTLIAGSVMGLFVSRWVSRTLLRWHSAVHEITEHGEIAPMTLAGVIDSPVTELHEMSKDLVRMQEAILSVRQRTEQRAESSEELFRATFDHAGVGIAHVTRDDVILRVNRRFREILALAPESGAGLSLTSLVRPEDRARAATLLARTRQGGERTEAIDVGFVAPVLATMNVSLVEAVGSSAAYLIVVIEDVTAIRELQRQVIHAQKTESLARLAGGMAHNFNNLLTVIVGRLGLLRDVVGHVREAVDELVPAQRAATQAATLSHQLLALAQRQVGTPQLIDVGAWVGRLMPRWLDIAGPGITVVVEPDSTGDQVRMDPAQFEQVVTHIVTNACEATKGAGRVTIRISQLRVIPPGVEPPTGPPPFMSLEVTDTGDGVPAEVRAHMFEPFITTKPLNLGAGLGLATSFGIVRQYGGTIQVEGAPGGGTTVRIILPAARALAFAAAPAAPVARAVATSGARTVLLAEDEAGVSQVAARALERAGFVVLQAVDGVAALDLASQHDGPIDVLVADAVLPRLGGLDLALRLRAERPHTRVLLMSGLVEDVQPAVEAAVPGVRMLSKPFTPKQLVDGVTALMVDN